MFCVTPLASGMSQWKIPVVVLSELRWRITLPGFCPLVLWYDDAGLFGTGLPLGKCHRVSGFAEVQHPGSVVVQSRASLSVPISVLVTMLLLGRDTPSRDKSTPAKWKGTTLSILLLFIKGMVQSVMWSTVAFEREMKHFNVGMGVGGYEATILWEWLTV